MSKREGKKYKDRDLHPYVAYLKNRYPDYDKWVRDQGIPLVKGHYIEDCRTAELSPWTATGGRGILINLSDQTVDDAYLAEIPAGGSLKSERHLYEELVYIVSGRGSTSVWQQDGSPAQFEWHAGSLFA